MKPLSKAQQIRHLATTTTLKPFQIAHKVNATPSWTCQVLSKARREGLSIPRFHRPPGISSVARLLTPQVSDRLRREARQRNLSSGELAAEILTIMAEDDLFAAILGIRGDDEE